jgi:transposase
MIVDTMLKDSDTPRYAVRRTKRRYSADTKAELMAACLVPGASIAAIASAHDINANVLHRWLNVQRRSKPNDGACAEAVALRAPAPELPSFIPVPLAMKPSEPVQQVIQVEVRKGRLTMTVTWPISAASDFARWSTAILK